MVPTIRESLRLGGVTWGTILLTLTFFLTGVRFLIGAQLHLCNEESVRRPGGAWLFDLMMIIIEATVFVFLGGLCSVETSRKALISFPELLGVFLLIDVVWVVIQLLYWRNRVPDRNKRPSIPWEWGALNIGLVLVLLLFNQIWHDPHHPSMLVVLAVSSTIGFIIDVVLVDRAKIL
jgi:hypothetical protein